MAGGNYPAAEVPFPRGFEDAVKVILFYHHARPLEELLRGSANNDMKASKAGGPR